MTALSRLTLAAFAALASCSSPGDQFAPACPRPAILRDANDLHRFRGAGRDFLDTVVQGRIVSLSGSCKRQRPNAVAATVRIGMELTRGPAAAGRVIPVAYFIAVTEGDKVLDKQVYTLGAEFPENTDRVQLTGDSVDLLLPVSAKVSADAYQITVGFQLTPEELDYNRENRARR